MSADVRFIGGVLGAVGAMLLLDWSVSAPDAALLLAGMVGYAVGTVLWIYSPLPHTNGGWGGPPAYRQKWGFTREPAHDIAEPTTEEILTAGIPTGWMWARRADSDDGGGEEQS